MSEPEIERRARSRNAPGRAGQKRLESTLLAKELGQFQPRHRFQAELSRTKLSRVTRDKHAHSIRGFTVAHISAVVLIMPGDGRTLPQSIFASPPSTFASPHDATDGRATTTTPRFHGAAAPTQRTH